jgi:hypothetical protein
VGLFFEGGILGIVATSKKKGNVFFSNSLFFEGGKNAYFLRKRFFWGQKLCHISTKFLVGWYFFAHFSFVWMIF